MEALPLAYDEYENPEMEAGLSPILLIHGFLWNKSLFKELAQLLLQRTKRKVYALDLRNHGDSPWSDNCGSYVMMKDIKRFIQEKKLKKVVFVCHSFSCTVAYLYTLEKPEVVEKLVFIDHPPFVNYSDDFFQTNVITQLVAQNRFLKTLKPQMTLEEARAKILDLAQKGSKGQQYFLKKVAYDLEKINNKFQWKTDQQYLMDKYREKKFAVPAKGSCNHEILIIRSENSIIMATVKIEDVLRHNPRTKLVDFKGTTHLLMFEKTVEFVEEVGKFLSEESPKNLNS